MSRANFLVSLDPFTKGFVNCNKYAGLESGLAGNEIQTLSDKGEAILVSIPVLSEHLRSMKVLT